MLTVQQVARRLNVRLQDELYAREREGLR